MERYVFGIALVAMIVGGVCMLIWPAAVVKQNRDEDEKACPLSGSEIRRMRVVGVLLIAGATSMRYALVSGMAGAELIGV
jgi:hypothetical protein